MSPRWARITKIVNASIVRSSVNATPLPPNPRTYSRPYKTFQSTSILLFRLWPSSRGGLAVLLDLVRDTALGAFVERGLSGTCGADSSVTHRPLFGGLFLPGRLSHGGPSGWSLPGGFPDAAEIKHERRPRYDEAEHTDREGHQVSHQDADGGGHRRNPPDG